MTFLIIGNAAGLFISYKNVNHPGIKFSRMLLFVITSLLFITLLGDNHAFEDTTLPQKIEEHMTWQARERHGDKNLALHNETWNRIQDEIKEARDRWEAAKAANKTQP